MVVSTQGEDSATVFFNYANTKSISVFSALKIGFSFVDGDTIMYDFDNKNQFDNFFIAVDKWIRNNS